MLDYRLAIVMTDGKSRQLSRTSSEAHKCRDEGIIMTAIGIKGALEDELHNIAGDSSRVFNVANFELLDTISEDIKQTTCSGNAYLLFRVIIQIHISFFIRKHNIRLYLLTRSPL